MTSKERLNFCADLGYVPPSSFRFAAFLDFMGLLCAFPVISTLTYGVIWDFPAEIPTSSFLLMISVSTIAVMLPVTHNVDVSYTPVAGTKKEVLLKKVHLLTVTTFQIL